MHLAQISRPRNAANLGRPRMNVNTAKDSFYSYAVYGLVQED